MVIKLNVFLCAQQMYKYVCVWYDENENKLDKMEGKRVIGERVRWQYLETELKNRWMLSRVQWYK